MSGSEIGSLQCDFQLGRKRSRMLLPDGVMTMRLPASGDGGEIQPRWRLTSCED